MKSFQKYILPFIFIVFLLTLSQNSFAKKPTPPPPSNPAETALQFLSDQIGPAGILDSFVEDNADYSYTYDNAMAAMAFISAGDINSAQIILDAYRNLEQGPDGGFYHRYNSVDGTVAYGILFVGPNTYLLQAMNLYYLETSDPRYNYLRIEIADFILSLQDSDGGIFGKSDVTWKSTENNLGSLSGIHNLGVLQNSAYYIGKAQDIQDFLINECWDGTRFYTGENDPMIVTDVQALGTIVLGPSYSNGAYWIENYTLNTQRYSGRKRVTGFDMNVDRDTVWTEGTLQQSLAFLVDGNLTKSNAYKSETEKLIQPSGALLQASNAGTTGFGEDFYNWEAVAPTAWYVLVANQDNTLELLPAE